MMGRIRKAVNWENIEALLRECYHVGQSHEGADAYSPLMLLKSVLLQKWYHIPSDPELENQTCPVESEGIMDKSVTTKAPWQYSV